MATRSKGSKQAIVSKLGRQLSKFFFLTKRNKDHSFFSDMGKQYCMTAQTDPLCFGFKMYLNVHESTVTPDNTDAVDVALAKIDNDLESARRAG